MLVAVLIKRDSNILFFRTFCPSRSTWWSPTPRLRTEQSSITERPSTRTAQAKAHLRTSALPTLRTNASTITGTARETTWMDSRVSMWCDVGIFHLAFAQSAYRSQHMNEKPLHVLDYDDNNARTWSMRSNNRLRAHKINCVRTQALWVWLYHTHVFSFCSRVYLNCLDRCGHVDWYSCKCQCAQIYIGSLIYICIFNVYRNINMYDISYYGF